MSDNRLTLYELSLEAVQINDMLEAGEGELTPELEQRLDALMVKGPESIEAAAIVTQNLLASALVCEQEALRLKARADSFTANANRLKERLAIALDCAFNGKLKTNRFTCWVQSAADHVGFDVEAGYTIDDVEKADPSLVRVKRELDKVALKERFKAGDPLPIAVHFETAPGKRFCRIK